MNKNKTIQLMAAKFLDEIRDCEQKHIDPDRAYKLECDFVQKSMITACCLYIDQVIANQTPDVAKILTDDIIKVINKSCVNNLQKYLNNI